MREMIGGPVSRARAVVGLTAGVVCALAALAPAAQASSPIALDGAGNGSPPQLAFDHATDTAYVAWSAPTKQNHGNGINLCVLPAGATKCKNGVQLLTDPDYTGSGAISLGGVLVLPEGEEVVLGVTNSSHLANGTVAWASAPGGAGFFAAGHGLQNGGALISPVSLFYAVGNAVPLSSSDVALLDDYGNWFSDSPFAGPESTEVKTNPGGLYPQKALGTNGPEIAAEPAKTAGQETIVGVGDDFATGKVPHGCSNDEDTGYGVSVGTVGPSGTLNTKGLPAYSLIACSASTPVVAHGGRDGIGVLEQEGNGFDGKGSTYTMDYRPFVATSTGGHFGAPVQLQNITKVTLDGADAIDLSDDSVTGVYASWVDDQGLVLDFSPNGGAKWDGAVPIHELADHATQGDPVIAGVSKGKVLVAYDNALHPGGDQVFLEGTDVIPTCTPSSTATTDKKTVTLSVKCTSALNVSVDIKKGTTKLATGKFTINQPDKSQKLTVKLTTAGKNEFKSHHQVMAKLILASDVFTTTTPLTITVHS